MLDTHSSKISIFSRIISTIAPVLRTSVSSVLIITMAVGGHLPVRTAYAADDTSPNIIEPVQTGDHDAIAPPIGIDPEQAEVEAKASAAVANEDHFRLLNLGLPTITQKGLDASQTLFAFHAHSTDPHRSTVVDHLNARDKSSLIDLPTVDGVSVEKITFQDPKKDIPYLYFTADKGEIIKQAVYIDGVFYFVTEGAIDVAGTKVNDTKLNIIDLNRYKNVIGQARPPIFQMSLLEGEKIALDGENLIVGGKTFERRLMQVYIDAQELTFNIGANLLDPITYDAAKAIVADLETYVERSSDLAARDLGKAVQAEDGMRTSMEEYLNRQAGNLESRVREVQVSRAEAKVIGMKKAKIDEVKTDNVETLIAETAAAKAKQTKISARLALINRLLQKPRYFGSRLYLQAIETLGHEKRLSPLAEERYRDAARNGRIKRVVTGIALSKVAITGAVATIAVFDIPHTVAVLQTTQSLAGEAGNWIHGVASVTVEALKGVTASIWDTKAVIYDKLLAPGQRHKLGWMLFGMFSSFALIAASSHFGVVLVKIKREYNAYRRTQRRKNLEVLPFKEFVIQRQQAKQAEYIDNLTREDDGSRSEKKWTEEETIRVREVISNLKAKDKGIILKVINRLKKEKHTPIVTFMDALKHSMFSMAGFTDSQLSLMTAYNSFFYWRSYAMFLPMDFMSYRYPNAVRIIMSRDGEVVLPTETNGGIRTRSQERRLRKDGWDLAELKIWEAKVVDVERAIEETALRQSWDKLTEFFTSSEELAKFYAEGGISSVSDPTISKKFEDPRIARLSKDARAYLLNHYEVLSSEMMVEFLRDVAKRFDVSGGIVETDYKNASLDELKAATIKAIDKLNLTPDDAQIYLRRVSQRIDIEATVQKKIASSDRSWIERYRWKISRRLDPHQNAQSNRIHTVRRLSKIPENVIRATRNAIAEIVVDKPLEIVQTVVLLAGVTTGISALFQDKMFGDNSIFYLGRFAFLYGYVWMTFFSILSSSAGKLQLDQVNEKGTYKNVPKGVDAERGFIRWYVKHLIPSKTNPNKFGELHKHIVTKMVIPNIPAYLTMTIPIQLIFLGRVEWDTLLMGYALYFAGTGTIDAYADQAFERSAAYPVAKIPEALRGHPEARMYINDEQQVLRFKINFFTKSLQNVIGIFQSTIMTIDSVAGVPKAFIRSFFGGYTPTELVMNPLAVLRDAGANIPGVRHIAAAPYDFCSRILLNTYQDGVRLIK